MVEENKANQEIQLSQENQESPEDREIRRIQTMGELTETIGRAASWLGTAAPSLSRTVTAAQAILRPNPWPTVGTTYLTFGTGVCSDSGGGTCTVTHSTVISRDLFAVVTPYIPFTAATGEVYIA